jgi:hypothetical protein
MTHRDEPPTPLTASSRSQYQDGAARRVQATVYDFRSSAVDKAVVLCPPPSRERNPLWNDENHVCARSAQPPRVPVERSRCGAMGAGGGEPSITADGSPCGIDARTTWCIVVVHRSKGAKPTIVNTSTGHPDVRTPLHPRPDPRVAVQSTSDIDNRGCRTRLGPPRRGS